MRVGRLAFLAGAVCACVAGACSLVVSTDGLSGGPPVEGGSPGGGDAGEAAAAGHADAGDLRDGEPQSGDSSVDSGVADALPADSGPHDAARDAVASDSGAKDAGADGPTCKNDLSNIGLADFTIALTVTTSQTGLVAVVNQRGVCNIAMLWDVRLSNGNLDIETCDGPHYSQVTTNGALANDGKPHAILVERRSQVITAFIDGKSVGTTSSTASFGQLPPLESGVDPCDSHSGNSALVGTVTGLCVTSP